MHCNLKDPAKRQRKRRKRGLIYHTFHNVPPYTGASQPAGFLNRCVCTASSRVAISADFSGSSIGPNHRVTSSLSRKGVGEIMPDSMVDLGAQLWGRHSNALNRQGKRYPSCHTAFDTPQPYCDSGQLPTSTTSAVICAFLGAQQYSFNGGRWNWRVLQIWVIKPSGRSLMNTKWRPTMCPQGRGQHRPVSQSSCAMPKAAPFVLPCSAS